MPQPFGEVFGFPIDNRSPEADDSRNNRLCPFKGSGQRCYKTRADDPIGVCSVFSAGRPAIICPTRFLEGRQVAADAAGFFFPKGATYEILPEVRVSIDVAGRSNVAAGNIDLVLAQHDGDGKLLDWGALEIQSVYTSGSIGKVFKAYQAKGYPEEFSWPAGSMPNPDWLSSTRKRLAPQILFKGTLLKKWGKKQAVAVQQSFYERLPELDVPGVQVPPEQAELAWFIYDIDLDAGSQRYTLRLKRTIYTAFDSAMLLITKPPEDAPDSVPPKLHAKIQQKLREAIAGKVTLDLDAHTSPSGAQEEG